MTTTQSDQATTSDERKTKELCGHEHEGLRCMRSKGHDGEHEALTAVETVTWR